VPRYIFEQYRHLSCLNIEEWHEQIIAEATTFAAMTGPGLPNQFGRLAPCGSGRAEVLQSNSAIAWQRLVQNWVTDVQRRGARLDSLKRSKGVLHLSLQGKDRFRYSLQIDFRNRLLRIELNRPEWKWVKRETLLLNAGSLRYLAKRMCPLAERHAVVPVRLLVRLSILCHAYRRLLQDYDQEHHSHSSRETVRQMEVDLRQYLTVEEQQSLDRPIVQTSLPDGQS